MKNIATMLLLALLMVLNATGAREARAARPFHISDFRMGMSLSEVRDIVASEYGYSLENNAREAGNMIVNPRGDAPDPDAAEKIGLVSFSAETEHDDPMVPRPNFTFHNDRLVQIRICFARTGIDGNEVLEALRSKYPGVLITYYRDDDKEKRFPITNFYGKSDDFDIVFITGDNNVVYSVKDHEKAFSELAGNARRDAASRK